MPEPAGQRSRANWTRVQTVADVGLSSSSAFGIVTDGPGDVRFAGLASQVAVSAGWPRRLVEPLSFS